MQPSPNILLHTLDTNLKNIKKWAAFDSGATDHLLALDALVHNKKVTKKPISVTLPDGDQVHSTHAGDLDIPLLHIAAQYCHIIPGLTNYSLISVVELCEGGCDTIFTKFGIGVDVRYR